MNQGELMQRLTSHNTWWSSADWERDDPDLSRLAQAPFEYEPDPLRGIDADGLYFLRGPRRVGKSVEVKRTVAGLIRRGTDPRAIVHFACNGLAPAEVRNLVLAAQRILGSQEGRRYWFLDEITAAQAGWPDAVAHLRDNNLEFRQDCVVLTGSSTREMDKAIKALADRRGQQTAGDDRLLLPMGFRDFCSIIEPDRELPQPAALRPRDFGAAIWPESAYSLAPFLNDLVQLWELYLTIGGFPRAVWDYKATAQVSESFVNGLWQVIYGEAIRSGAYSALQIHRLLSELTQRLTAPTNFTQLAEDCGLADHSVASARCVDLVSSYILWPCYPTGAHGLPHLGAQRKFYYYDPLLARLASLLDSRNPAPSYDALSEQQLGLSLLRALRREQPSSFEDYSNLMFLKTATRNEVDFVGQLLDPAAFESKYIDTKKTQATAALKALKERRGVMASRAFFDPEASVPWLPASFLAYLLDDDPVPSSS
jgi:hypothetical protein